MTSLSDLSILDDVNRLLLPCVATLKGAVGAATGCLLAAALACNADAVQDEQTPDSSAADAASVGSEADAESLSFTEVSGDFGLAAYLGPHGTNLELEAANMAGGIAAGDYDGDGDVDVYLVTEHHRGNALLRNDAGSGFTDVTEAAGVQLLGHRSSGPTFADVDGDGALDLLVGGVGDAPVVLFMNNGDGTFRDGTSASHLEFRAANSLSSNFGDYDGDGWLDLFVSHWGKPFPNWPADTEHLWRNEGGSFSSASVVSGLAEHVIQDLSTGSPVDRTFSANFSDINEDGALDLLVASDFGTSQVYINDGDGRLRGVEDRSVITDGFGMGSLSFDYDNDGHVDWFVSSIGAPSDSGLDPAVYSGNHLYRNLGRGDGAFEDATQSAGVALGYWGWGTCAADFDNDGYLDVFEVNGWSMIGMQQFSHDPCVLFHSQGDGTFLETAQRAGTLDTELGRGVACFDFDADGDIDIFIVNQETAPQLYRNDSDNGAHWLSIRLGGLAPNTQGIGARITIDVGGARQLRELQAGTSFVSQSPPVAHFGLGRARAVDTLSVAWPDGVTRSLKDVHADQQLVITHPAL